jgi:DNA-binding response OmpR family regulator
MRLADAQRLIDGEAFDVMICDVDLPDGDGLQLLAYARRRFPVQGISLSGHGGDMEQRGEAADFAAHLSKPFSVAVLRDAMVRAMSRSSAGDMPSPALGIAAGRSTPTASRPRI